MNKLTVLCTLLGCHSAMMPARLVDLPDVSRQNSSPYFDDAITAATHHTVDSDILDAFQVGTRQFVEKSFAACKQVFL